MAVNVPLSAGQACLEQAALGGLGGREPGQEARGPRRQQAVEIGLVELGQDARGLPELGPRLAQLDPGRLGERLDVAGRGGLTVAADLLDRAQLLPAPGQLGVDGPERVAPARSLEPGHVDAARRELGVLELLDAARGQLRLVVDHAVLVQAVGELRVVERDEAHGRPELGAGLGGRQHDQRHAPRARGPRRAQQRDAAEQIRVEGAQALAQREERLDRARAHVAPARHELQHALHVTGVEEVVALAQALGALLELERLRHA